MLPALADDLAMILVSAPIGGHSCDELALQLHRRRADVLAALRDDERFQHDGRTRGSRWRLATSPWDGLAAVDRPILGSYPCLPSANGEKDAEVAG